MIPTLTPKFLDTDGYWKFSVTFDYGTYETVNTFYYDTPQKAGAALAKAFAAKDISEQKLQALGLENNLKP